MQVRRGIFTAQPRFAAVVECESDILGPLAEVVPQDRPQRAVGHDESLPEVIEAEFLGPRAFVGRKRVPQRLPGGVVDNQRHRPGMGFVVGLILAR